MSLSVGVGVVVNELQLFGDGAVGTYVAAAVVSLGFVAMFEMQGLTVSGFGLHPAAAKVVGATTVAVAGADVARSAGFEGP